MKPIGRIVEKIANSTLKTKGFSSAKVMLEWDKIVGLDFAKFGYPEKVVFPYMKRSNATLYIVCSSAGSMFFEYQSPMIIDRINTYFGYKAISKLRYRVDQLVEKPTDKAYKKISVENTEISASIKKITENIDDEELRDLLNRLGSAISKSKT